MFSDDIISRVRDSVDIVDLVSGYVSLKKTGKNHTGLCPFHSEKTPSFSVNPDKQIFHCFGCGAGGDAFKFLELQEGLNFPEAVRKLAERAGIVLPVDRGNRGQDKSAADEKAALIKVVADAAAYFQRELEGPAGSAARAYLVKRGVSDQTVKEFGLGFARNEWDGLLKHLRQKGYQPGQMERAGLIVKRSEGEGHYDRFRNRIIFPIRDIAGTVIAFGGRVMDDSLPKYLNSSETPLYSKSNTLYCFEMAKEAARRNDHFIIVEGYLDALACHQYGVKNATATLGTALTEGHLRLMRRFSKNVKLIFDPDPAGVKAALRSFDLLVGSSMNVKVVLLPDNDDPDTFLNKKGYNGFVEYLKKSIPLMDFVITQVAEEGEGSEISQKIFRARKMLEFVSKLPTSIERNHYLKKIAEILDLNEADLHQELAGQQQKHQVKASVNKLNLTTQQSRCKTEERPKAEETLIHLMLRDSSIAKQLIDQIKPEDFTDSLFRRIAEGVFKLLNNQSEIDTRSLFVEGDEELNNLISQYSVAEVTCEDPDQNCKDCVDIVKQRDPEKKLKFLYKAIKEAESRGDDSEVARLMKEQNQLGRRPERKLGKKVPGER